MERVSFGEYARRRGWSRPYVSQLVAAGKIPVDEARKIDPAEADASLAKFKDPSKAANGGNARRGKDTSSGGTLGGRAAAEPPPGGAGLTYTQVATARLGYQAQRARLAYERERGELTEAALVEEGVAAAFAMIRETLLAMPDRVSTRIAPTPEEARRVHALLEAEMKRALADLADSFEAMAAQRTATQQ